MTLSRPLFFFISLIVSILPAQEAKEEQKIDPRFESLSAAYGYLMNIEESLKQVETQFPELKEKVATVRKELSASQVGQGFSGLTDALKKMTGDEFERYDQTSRKQIRDLGAARKLDPKMARIALENISKVKGGALPREILRTVIAMNPTYREAPGKIFDDGWIAGFSTKMDPVKRKVHFLLYYPGTMKPLQPAAKSDLFRAQSDEGYGNAILTLRVIDAPDPKYAKMAPLDLAKLLVPESANVIESKPAKLAGLPAGRVTFDLKTEGRMFS